jgi:hypothetical protein
MTFVSLAPMRLIAMSLFDLRRNPPGQYPDPLGARLVATHAPEAFVMYRVPSLSQAPKEQARWTLPLESRPAVSEERFSPFPLTTAVSDQVPDGALVAYQDPDALAGLADVDDVETVAVVDHELEVALDLVVAVRVADRGEVWVSD